MKCDCGYTSKDRWLKNPLRCPQCDARIVRNVWQRQRAAFEVIRRRLVQQQQFIGGTTGRWPTGRLPTGRLPMSQVYNCRFCGTLSNYFHFDDGMPVPTVWWCPLGCSTRSTPCGNCLPGSVAFNPLRITRCPSLRETLGWDVIHLADHCSVIAFVELKEVAEDRVFGWHAGEAVQYGAAAATAIAHRLSDVFANDPWSEVARVVKRIAKGPANRSTIRKRMPHPNRLREQIMIGTTHPAIKAALAAVGGALLLGSSKTASAMGYGLAAAELAHEAGLSRVELAEIAVRTLATVKGNRPDERLVDAGAGAWLAGRPDVARRFIKRKREL